MGRTALANALIALGVVVALVGIAGTVADGGDGGDADGAAAAEPSSPAPSPSGPSPSPADSPAAGAPPSPSPAPSPAVTGTADPAGAVAEFFPRLAAAIRDGNAAFLFARLHPAVLDRYGTDQCRAYLDGLQGPLELSAEAVSGPEPWAWETDGTARDVPEVFTARLERTAGEGDDARTDETEAHVAFVEGEVRWFTDCGEPQ